MLTIKCVNQNKGWYRAVDINGMWLTHLEMDREPGYYLEFACRVGIPVMFLPTPKENRDD